MTTAQRSEEIAHRGAETFAATNWSVVLKAGRSHSTEARNALDRLCRTYWSPVYAFVRRQGNSPHDAQDLTQEFFARLLARNDLARVDQSKGRFRSFLLAAVKHFLANEWDKAHAQKRGGGRVPISVDVIAAEADCQFELAGPETAEKLFERRWALALLEQVLRRLRAAYVGEGKESLFEALKPTLTEGSGSVRYADLAERLGSTEGAVKVAVHRLRQRYREFLKAEIADTVADPKEIDEELRCLFRVLAKT